MAPSCEECNAHRFAEFNQIYRTHTLQIEHYEDYSNSTLHLKLVNTSISFKGKALVMLGASGPNAGEHFQQFIDRVDFVFGLFLTRNRFIGTSLPRYDIFNTSVWIITR